MNALTEQSREENKAQEKFLRFLLQKKGLFPEDGKSPQTINKAVCSP